MVTNCFPKVWKSAKVQHFRAEQDRLNCICKRSPRPITSMDYWGYHERPSTTEPGRPSRLAWVYIADLDMNTFSIGAYGIVNRKFQLDKIPVSMFAHASIPQQLMVAPIPQSHMADWCNFDPEFVALYKRSGPRLHRFGRMFDHADRSPNQMLRQILIDNFLRHYRKMIDLANTDSQTNACIFRQVAYGLLNICDLSTGLSFERVTLTSLYESFISSGRSAIPSWDYPASSAYILSSVIIVLEPRMNILEFLQAAIGKAISMAKTRPESHTALILCFDSVVIVYFTRTNGVLTVSHTDNILFCPVFRYYRHENIPNTGINAVLHTFASVVRKPFSTTPAPLPTELWQEVFCYSDAAAQNSLGRTCRFFRCISQQLPRFDNWGLERAHEDSTTIFVAVKNGERRRLGFEERPKRIRATENGYQAVLFVGKQRVELALPLLVAQIEE